MTKLAVTEGERSIIASYICVSIIGAWLAYVVGNTVNGSESLLLVPNFYDLWLAISGAVGSAIAIYMCRRWLGHADAKGMMRGLFAIPLVSFVAALVSGTLALPVYGTMFGPLALATTFIKHPFVAGTWVVCLIGTHAAFAIYRRERATIYMGPADDGIPS